MIAAALRGASLAGAAFLIADSSSLALWSVVVTSAAGLAAQLIKMYSDSRREERRHKWDVEAADTAAKAREKLQLGIAENTELTREAATKAELAYDTANHVNAKIARIAEVALAQDRAAAEGASVAAAEIRGDIAENTAVTREGFARGANK